MQHVSETTVLFSRTMGKFLSSRVFLELVTKIGSPSFRRRLIGYIPDRDLHHLRDIVDIMQETSEKLLQEKKLAILEGREDLGTGKGKDIMTVLRACSSHLRLLHCREPTCLSSQSKYGSVRRGSSPR